MIQSIDSFVTVDCHGPLFANFNGFANLSWVWIGVPVENSCFLPINDVVGLGNMVSDGQFMLFTRWSFSCGSGEFYVIIFFNILLMFFEAYSKFSSKSSEPKHLWSSHQTRWRKLKSLSKIFGFVTQNLHLFFYNPTTNEAIYWGLSYVSKRATSFCLYNHLQVPPIHQCTK